ncbi:DoxX family membrane protein [Stenotrophomonas sp. HITSZ_GD]|uniref:DoxX family membrane protein n=1 Tax=Stenotrophomonas sp. HITSZ_GD TaxID=3037248 RepID=UPI00240DEB51|nr:DoxX family membrane protein [Stenotrophomonas sp. HITSZ_GD]MDG2524231.1 DoxX family membrane protein [Stenotrophomonas sp. HITSZ_GD]
MSVRTPPPPLRYRLLGAEGVRWFACLALCAAYLQGALTKLLDFPAATAEMAAAGLAPAPAFAVAVIVLELVASAMVVSGRGRWLGAIALAAFTLAATAQVLRFWELPAGAPRTGMTNAFFEHLGLVGGFLLVAWIDVRELRQ